MNKKASYSSKRATLYKQKRGGFDASVVVFGEKRSSSIKVWGGLSCNLNIYSELTSSSYLESA